MYILQDFVLNLQDFLINSNKEDLNIIRKHTKKLNQLGDISFPLNINNWYQHIKSHNSDYNETIFSYRHPDGDINILKNKLEEKSHDWKMQIKSIELRNNDVHIFLNRSPVLYNTVIKEVLSQNEHYGSSSVIKSNVELNTSETANLDLHKMDLSTLRINLIKDVASNLVKCSTSKVISGNSSVFLLASPINNGCTNVLCGPVLNEKGIKSKYTANDLYQKRSSDMRMMAQHKYGVQVRPNKAWETYFDNLGKGSIVIEMLTNKPQKSIKITPNDLQSANKGPSFIFYNCARLSALFKEFDRRVSLKEYPDLPMMDNVDFSLLSQPEEWELFYVYIIQFPMIVISCIKDIEKGILNPQHLISYLSNLSSIFSVYYRRIRILTGAPHE